MTRLSISKMLFSKVTKTDLFHCFPSLFRNFPVPMLNLSCSLMVFHLAPAFKCHFNTDIAMISYKLEASRAVDILLLLGRHCKQEEKREIIFKTKCKSDRNQRVGNIWQVLKNSALKERSEVQPELLTSVTTQPIFPFPWPLLRPKQNSSQSSLRPLNN